MGLFSGLLGLATEVDIQKLHKEFEPLLVEGEELVAAYQSSPGLQRGFCRTCGSNLPVPGTAEESFFVPAGTLDDDPGVRPAAHIFVASKAPWVEITDDLPQFDEYPPGFGPDAES